MSVYDVFFISLQYGPVLCERGDGVAHAVGLILIVAYHWYWYQVAMKERFVYKTYVHTVSQEEEIFWRRRQQSK